MYHQHSQTKIVYFGNRLERHGFSPTGIDRLAPLLAESYDVVTASTAKVPLLRMADMVRVLLRNQDAAYALIDTYSTHAFYYAWILAVMCGRLGIPYIPILHGGDLASRLERSPRLCRQVFGNAFRNVAPSGFLRSVCGEKGFRVDVIPNPVEIGNYKFMRRHEVRPRLLYVRSFDRVYNPCLAVRILAGLVQEHSDAALCMVGPDKDGSRAEVEDLSRALGVHERVRFTGKLAPEVWRDVSEDYDVFINTTDVDNTPFSVIEAMALGLPVVSTAVGGLPYLVTDERDGFLVSRDSPEEFIACIDRLIRAPELVAKITWNARNTVHSHASSAVQLAWKELLFERPRRGNNPAI